MDIWVVGTLNQLFTRDSYTKIKLLKKQELTGEIRSFCTPLSICLNISFWQDSLNFLLPFLFVLTLGFDKAVLNGNVAFSIDALSSKKRYSSFYKKGLVFLKTYFKVKVMKTFKISSYCHVKTCQSLKWILKIPSTYVFFDNLKMKPLRLSVFLY